VHGRGLESGVCSLLAIWRPEDASATMVNKVRDAEIISAPAGNPLGSFRFDRGVNADASWLGAVGPSLCSVQESTVQLSLSVSLPPPA
jgi:hypothetical protein